MTTNVEIEDISDFKGQKIRTMENANHLPHYIVLFMNQELFKGLAEEDQKILTEAADTAREQADERIEDRMKIIEESGTQVITPSEELYAQMREASEETGNAVREQVGDELVDSYLKK